MIKKNFGINFIFIHLRKKALTIIFVLFAIGLIAFSRDNLAAAKDGLTLWFTSVVPALLPFFIACELLSQTDIIDFLGKKLTGIMKPIFNVPGVGAFPLVMGIISGSPVGARIVTNFRNSRTLYKRRRRTSYNFYK